MAEPRYSFSCTWNDPSSSLPVFLVLTYFPIDATLDLVVLISSLNLDLVLLTHIQYIKVNIKHKRLFMKRSPAQGLTMKDLTLGATVTVYGRVLLVTGFADEATRKQLEVALET